jgi:hypothetical protein
MLNPALSITVPPPPWWHRSRPTPQGRGRREEGRREGKKGRAEDAKPPSSFETSETEVTLEFVFFATGLHCMAS